ncbi:sensor histidine kinase [Actinocorallia sp. A-T 12471]|uniref:sensor histidine kinase n=1 Tax=Actinocorallia sp. A-T 12471 TaxID=3089813 RepID=UPI0029CFC5B4|nr:histidine kinase [Actinocorallia sp. A-T 12471]MDX6744755.1 histidine kinase [Actinocorallia sp. A-T 12471]
MRPLRPLFTALTWRRWTFLLLGGLLCAPAAVVVGFVGGTVQTFARSPLLAAALTFGVSLLLISGLGLLPVVRRLEGAVAAELLGAPAVVGDCARWPARLRAAVWFVAHLFFGALACVATVFAPPVFIYGMIRPILEGVAWWPSLIGVVLVPAFLYGIVFSGRIAAKVAEWALGPSAQERVEAAERRASVQVERTRLARELHDSVGHALSIVTVQSAAAERVLDRDPDFARQALKAIGDSARTALEDLDHVLGLLREEESARAPQRTLRDLDDLLAKTGLDIAVECEGDLDRLPSAVSREAYRIVQEGLTNVAKHAGRVPVELRLAARPGVLDLELCNPMGARTHGRDTGGRGLAGLSERVGVLAGRFSAGALDGRWRLSASIPLPKGTS